MKINECQAKPDIEYPCPWLFKVIGFDRREIEKAIAETVGETEISVAASKSSGGGEYHSVNLEMEVIDEAHRDSIYTNLSAHVAIKVVL